jgi:hypothetical protein
VFICFRPDELSMDLDDAAMEIRQHLLSEAEKGMLR